MPENLPNPLSYEQILGDALSQYAADQGIDDFNVGSTITSFMEVLALVTARASGDIFQILRDFSVDRATGDALQRLAIENLITPITAKPATGGVTVIDESFLKIATKVYAGTMPPNIGSTTINVSDASEFPATGSVYIGRGTLNVEGPISYSVAPFQSGNFWVITLDTGTTKFHNLQEAVILAQGGNRSIPINTVVISPSVGATLDIQYGVTTAAIILDGETTVTNVQVSALLPGASGNVPIGAIKSFSSPPFAGATVTNPLPFTTGRDNETDDQLRVRIKRRLASTGLGTATAVESAVIGATPSDEQATIVNTDLILISEGAVLFIDSGGAYEAKSQGVGLESIVDSALGGEKFFQLITGGRQAPVAKAFLVTTISGPFDLIGTDALAVIVGGHTYEHVFQTSDFRSPGSATAYEVSASINANTALGFEATTSGGGTLVVIRAKAEDHDYIQITTPVSPGRDAAVLLGFPASEIQTLRLYKNKIPLTKDGNTATVFSESQALWSATIASGDTLILSVDGTDFITYTITDADFIETGLYLNVNATNSLESWVQVFNNKLTGVTAEIVGQKISITSNLLESDRAEVIIDDASTLVSKGMFTALTGLSATGKTSDFTLERNTAQIELVVPLVAGDELTAGSDQTEARIESDEITAGSVTFASDAHVWILIDDPGEIIPTGVVGNSLLDVTKPATNIIRYTSNSPNSFANVQLGDYIIVWTEDLLAPNRIEGRVNAFTSTTIDVLITATEWAAVTPQAGIIFTEGFIILRSTVAPQKFKLAAGTQSLDQIAINLQAQTNSLIFTVEQDEVLIIRSRTKDTSGYVLIVTADNMGQLLSLPIGGLDQSKDSLIAFYDTNATEAELPLFVHAGFATGTSANPPDSYIASFVASISFAGRDPNELISILHPYGLTRDAQPYRDVVQVKSITGGTTIAITQHPTVRRLRTVDRYYIANPLDFGHNDTAVVIVDNDPASGSFEIPLYRRATTNTSLVVNPLFWNAYDTDSGATAAFSAAFGNFDFSNFKALMQAKKTLKPTPPQTALLYRAIPWGRSGEKINVGYVYPSVPNAPIGSTVTVDDDVIILINLKSGPASSTFIDASTEWNVSITPNTPVAGIDQVTYTWNTVGTNPALALTGGEYVNITTQTEFDERNTGIFRVSTEAGFTPTATSFSVQRATGAALAEINKATQVNGAITFYDDAPTTAAEINTYVNTNLTLYVTSTIVNDGGTSGSGIIVLETYEDSGFLYRYVQLLDGINWIASSNLGGSPQFTFKESLDLPTDVGYSFNDGEEVRLIPTTMDQVRRLISILAVSGFTTVGTVGVVDRATKLELATKTLGSNGSIQIVGGLGNQFEVPILDAGFRVDNTLMSASVNAIAGKGIHSDQWFRLEATTAQKKETLLSSNSAVTIVGDFPTVGQSTVTLLNRSLTQRYFGRPRHHIRSRARNFRIEKQGKLVCLSWDGIGTTPAFSKAANMNDSGGGTVDIVKIVNTSDATYTITSGNADFNEMSIGDLITIAGMDLPENNGTFLVTGVSDDGLTLRVQNPDATSDAADAFVAGNFSATLQVTEGDTMILTAPFNVLNRGTFRVIRRYNNSVWFENINVVEEEVTLPYAPIDLSFDATTAFEVDASNNSAYLTWNGVGNEPLLGNAQMGDVVTFGTSFNVANQGQFMVSRSGVKLPEITNFTMPAGSQFTLGGPGKYFNVNSAGDLNLYYVWFNVNGGNSDPAVGGRVGLPVAILSGDTAAQVATKAQVVVNVATGLDASVSNNVLTVTTTDSIETTDATAGTMPSPFSLTVIQHGRRTFLEAINPAAVNEAAVLVTVGVLEDHRPQMQFYEYEASIPGDKFVLTNSVFGLSNLGSHPIVSVLDRDTIIVGETLIPATNVSLNNIEDSTYVEEDTPYYGYKRVLFASSQPGAPLRTLLTFDTNAQYSKIDQDAGVQMVSLNKLDYDTIIKNGLDSYRFNTGLIGEANRIIYGDPRDPSTYPGVGAAGATIFVREPLARRIQVALNIRLKTGVPFAATAEQVRNAVSSLVNANPVGDSIAISAIVAVVVAIPGILAVAVSSPQYDSTHDIIVLAPGEKAFITDPTLDISVSQIGS